jgi:hypothetical protein
MSLWRKRETSDTNRDTNAPDVGHNEQKHDILTYPLDILHEENVRLGLYEGVYDLSIKSDDLSIKSEEAMREVQKLGQEIEIEYVLKVEDDDDIQEYKMPWQPLNWGDMPIGQVNNFDFMEGARWAEKWLKDKNT